MKCCVWIGKRDGGFTMVELMIVVAVIAILAAIAIPGVINWLPNYRLKVAARELVANFQRAKLEAVKRNTDVVISFTPVAFTPTGGVGSYLIFVDDGSGGGTAGNDVRDGTETILSQDTMLKDVSLISAVFPAVGNTTPGYTFRGLPLQARVGDVQVKNGNLRRYRATLSMAGNVHLDVSHNDGVTWGDF